MDGKTHQALMERHLHQNAYSEGYNPKAVEHDLVAIRQLMKGRKKLTMRLAQDIYYRIRREDIRFQSEQGADFLKKLFENMTEAQMQETDRLILQKKRRASHRRRLLRLNKKIIIGIFAAQLVLCVLFLNWNLILDVRTNYETAKLQAKIGTAVNKAEASQILPETVAETVVEGAMSKLVAGQTDNSMQEGSPGTTPVILDKFQLLHEENADFAGWLKIDGTKIDYPVMSREGDNNYYLDKNFAHQKDKNGLLVLDYRSDVLASGQNIIIYGHNMRTGVMFGALKAYKDKSFCEKNPLIHFDSLYEEGEYQVIAAALSEVAYEDEDVFRYYDAIDISTEESFYAFKENIYSSAIYTNGKELQYGDSCLILSTCDNYKEDGRFVVVARKRNNSKDTKDVS